MKLRDYPHTTVVGCEARDNGARRVIRLHGDDRFACYEHGDHHGVATGVRDAVRWLEGEAVAEPVPGMSVTA